MKLALYLVACLLALSVATPSPGTSPSSPDAPFTEDVTPEILQTGTYVVASYGVIYGVILVFAIIIIVAIFNRE